MSKKSRTSPKREKSSTSMGRVLFYLIALIVACCAVAVVLFETKTGQDFIARVRGKQAFDSEQNKKASSKDESKHSERKIDEGGSQKTNAETTKTASDASAKPKRKTSEAKISDSTNADTVDNRAQEKRKDSEPGKGTDGDYANAGESRADEPASSVDSRDEREEWERVAEEIDAQQDEPVLEQEEPVLEAVKPVEAQVGEEEKPIEAVDLPVVEMEKESLDAVLEDMNEEQDERMHESDANEMGDEEVEPEEVLNVGDSLLDLERKRAAENKQAEEEMSIEGERYDPIAQPEGPPIDQHPVNARRGLRGDYGHKDCKDQNKSCSGWAQIGECEKNPVWMKVNCKKSCDVCSCSDNDVKCGEWAWTGECAKNPHWMNENCMKSCQQC